MVNTTTTGMIVRAPGAYQAAGAVARYGDGGTYGQTNGALNLLQRAGQAVEVSQKIRDMVASNPAFAETFTSDYSRTNWTEPFVMDKIGKGASVDAIVKSFADSEEQKWKDDAPKAAQPRKADMEAAILNGTEDALAAALVMKDRVATAMHYAKRSKFALPAGVAGEGPDVKRFRAWLDMIVAKQTATVEVIAPPSNRQMKRMVREFINMARDGVSVLNVVKDGLDLEALATGTAMLNGQSSKADPLAAMTTIKPEAAPEAPKAKSKGRKASK